jgi:hypothetical protein
MLCSAPTLVRVRVCSRARARARVLTGRAAGPDVVALVLRAIANESSLGLGGPLAALTLPFVSAQLASLYKLPVPMRSLAMRAAAELCRDVDATVCRTWLQLALKVLASFPTVFAGDRGASAADARRASDATERAPDGTQIAAALVRACVADASVVCSRACARACTCSLCLRAIRLTPQWL